MKSWLMYQFMMVQVAWWCLTGCRHWWCFLDGITFCRVRYFCNKHDRLIWKRAGE